MTRLVLWLFAIPVELDAMFRWNGFLKWGTLYGLQWALGVCSEFLASCQNRFIVHTAWPFANARSIDGSTQNSHAAQETKESVNLVVARVEYLHIDSSCLIVLRIKTFTEVDPDPAQVLRQRSQKGGSFGRFTCETELEHVRAIRGQPPGLASSQKKARVPHSISRIVLIKRKLESEISGHH
mmetsp:Transcript_11954/g.33104  ORF Transcript_11954/g.33104 Transcript_11954/m.33104 type:complete len:182 (+) Transcript_11954:148-693(+)